MNRDTYLRFYKHINGTIYQKALKVCDIGCVILTAVAYVLLLFYYFRQQDERLLFTVTIPAAGFCALTLVRSHINSPRPYEVWDVPSLIGKTTKGESFPSRHVFSIFLIATLYAFFHPAMGMVYYGMAIELAVIRVITGTHFVKDVLVGALAGILVGLLYGLCIYLI